MFHFEVTLPGHDVIEAEADSRDIVFWEALGKGRHFGQLETALRMTDLAELAWFSLYRQRLLDDLPDRPAFLRVAKVVPVSVEKDEEEGLALDPTRPDLSTG